MRAPRVTAGRGDRARSSHILDQQASAAREFSRRLVLLDGHALLTLCHKPGSWAALEVLRMVASKRGAR